MKILTVVGARPQFIKASMISLQIKKNSNMKEIMVHTGQHYDDNMSNIFFHQLKLPKPDYNLAVGSDTHSKQTAKMLSKLEDILLLEKPDIVFVYGDTNSTLAGSLAAAKLHYPIAHVESGLRSYNKKMPEEINRVITDHLSTWLFCPSQTAVENLRLEGITKGVYLTGDIMVDAIIHFRSFAKKYSNILTKLNLSPKEYYLVTIHRAENTDDPKRLAAIIEALRQLDRKVVFPLHPRTKNRIKQWDLTDLLSHPNILTTEPINYFDMLIIENEAKVILTDSGGIQKEAYLLQVPCITIRDETEWVETVQSGWNQLTSANTQNILNTLFNMKIPKEYPHLFGDGHTKEKIIDILTNRKR
ncbi:non-hydrolyzing UDP-N-acetylglucosamine 2-epimerase [Aeribacillus alveayuensis]|uniref:UDP-N-acetylglucosamine 2-epimerase n=1 Tax=Aeribacillus alveayuensis TaxID=279215 RepID=A0ABT9VNQ5_9BACI|nr:UDP-N-acetylglucosamine 2-epimerase [Bacillus alveayuensis]